MPLQFEVADADRLLCYCESVPRTSHFYLVLFNDAANSGAARLLKEDTLFCPEWIQLQLLVC